MTRDIQPRTYCSSASVWLRWCSQPESDTAHDPRPHKGPLPLAPSWNPASAATRTRAVRPHPTEPGVSKPTPITGVGHLLAPRTILPITWSRGQTHQVLTRLQIWAISGCWVVLPLQDADGASPAPWARGGHRSSTTAHLHKDSF